MDLLNFEVAQEYLGVLLQGLAVTVYLTLIVIVMSAVLAIPVALARMSSSRLIRLPVDAYVEVARATPLLLQLIYIYYVLPSIGIRLPQMLCAFIGLTFNYTAYMSEVYRGGINAVAQGQWLAAAALGMTDSLAFRRIILPQAVRIVIPSLGNYFISLFKDTALASAVAVPELTYAAEWLNVNTFRTIEAWTFASVMYLIAGYGIAFILRRVERRYAVIR